MSTRDDPGVTRPPLAALALLQIALGIEDPLPDPSTDIGRRTRDWLARNWEDARSGLLARTTTIQVDAPASAYPNTFAFRMQRPYKRRCPPRQDRPEGGIELAPGPIRGVVKYRPDLLTAPPGEACVLVLVDPELRLMHANLDPATGLLCTGDLVGPIGLESLLIHAFSILSYQNMNLASALDPRAAHYFATDPEAFAGLLDVQPLWGTA